MTETNYSIRKKLGEAGFNQVGINTFVHGGGNQSTWKRNADTITLTEYKNSEPVLVDTDGVEIYTNELGVSNVNTQNDGSPEE